MTRHLLIIVGAAAICGAPSLGYAQAQFRQGECSGVLCSTVGGSQAPQNQPRKSLFPEGECGGILCSAVGGSQAPKPVGPPPACGGGLLCDIAPYSVGQPFIKPEEVERRRQAEAAVPPPAPVLKEPKRHRRAKAAREAKSSD